MPEPHMALPTVISGSYLSMSLQVREEGTDYLLFVKGEGRYLFANEEAVKIVWMLSEGASVASLVNMITEMTQTDPVDACVQLSSVITMLRSVGVLSTPLTDGDDVALKAPRIWKLEDVLDGSAEKCDTFGMPF